MLRLACRALGRNELLLNLQQIICLSQLFARFVAKSGHVLGITSLLRSLEVNSQGKTRRTCARTVTSECIKHSPSSNSPRCDGRRSFTQSEPNYSRTNMKRKARLPADARKKIKKNNPEWRGNLGPQWESSLQVPIYRPKRKPKR